MIQPMEGRNISQTMTVGAIPTINTLPSAASNLQNLIPKPSKKRSFNVSSRLSRRNTQTFESTVLSEEEEKLSVVGDIQQEIVDNALSEVYERYLEKQTVYFVSHCSRLAWVALVKWNFQKKDKGGFKESDRERLDTEPVTSPKDSWAGHSIAISQAQRKVSYCSQVDDSLGGHSILRNDSSMDPSRKCSPETKLSKSVTLVKPVEKLTRAAKKISKKYVSEKQINARFRKSEEFPRALLDGRTFKVDDLKKDSYELPAPSPLQPKHFPSSRVEVQYAIMPGNPAKGLARQKDLKIKTIILKKPKNV